jgi:hypothetical protein
MKLAKADLVGRYTPDEMKTLRDRQLYAAKDGTPADVVAELFGFPSGDALVRALIAAPTMKDRIEGETSARLKAKLGDVILDGRLADQAQQAVYGEGRQQVVHAELKALTAGMVKGTIPPASVINAHGRAPHRGYARARRAPRSVPDGGAARQSARLRVVVDASGSRGRRPGQAAGVDEPRALP